MFMMMIEYDAILQNTDSTGFISARLWRRSLCTTSSSFCVKHTRRNVIRVGISVNNYNNNAPYSVLLILIHHNIRLFDGWNIRLHCSVREMEYYSINTRFKDNEYSSWQRLLRSTHLHDHKTLSPHWTFDE